ncbi:MAG: hypothetical protein VXW22_04800 [Pseudomonadota bacterium]|nr:hypothetical protein [Pseudomonadota bacterium]
MKIAIPASYGDGPDTVTGKGHFGAMSKQNLSMTDFEYVADLLRALRVFAPEFENLSDAVTQELVESLGVSEAALRRAAAEVAMKAQD